MDILRKRHPPTPVLYAVEYRNRCRWMSPQEDIHVYLSPSSRTTETGVGECPHKKTSTYIYPLCSMVQKQDWCR